MPEWWMPMDPDKIEHVRSLLSPAAFVERPFTFGIIIRPTNEKERIVLEMMGEDLVRVSPDVRGAIDDATASGGRPPGAGVSGQCAGIPARRIGRA